MQKNKLLNNTNILVIIRSCLLGIVITLVGIIVFAFILKFIDLSQKAISYVNDLIKMFSIFIMMTIINKKNRNMLFFKSILAGCLYAFFSFVIFSILNGSFIFDLSFIYDLLFDVIVSMIIAVIINILSHKKV